MKALSSVLRDTMGSLTLLVILLCTIETIFHFHVGNLVLTLAVWAAGSVLLWMVFGEEALHG